MNISPLPGFRLDRALLAARAPVLVVLTSPGCGACRHLLRLLDGLAAPAGLGAAYGVDAGEAGGLLEDHGIFHLPALLLAGPGGDPVARIDAEARAPALTAALEAALRSVTGPSP